MKRNGNNLELTINGTEAKLIVANYFSGSYHYNNDATKRVNKVEEIRFADGTVWDVDYVENEVKMLMIFSSVPALLDFVVAQLLIFVSLSQLGYDGRKTCHHVVSL